jgi:ketosteroid isomerase-like protein
MSQENVEIVRRIYSEWERGEFGRTVERFDPEVVFESFMPDSSERIIAHGPRGVEAFMREFLAQWRDYRVFGEEFQQLGEEKVFVAGSQAAKGRQSGAAVEVPAFTIWTFRHGRVTRLVFELDRQKALEAAGVTE